MSEQQAGKPPLSLLEDDDNCSEFSVISNYDDQDDMFSTHNGSSTGHPRVAYVDPSIHDSEFADNLSVVSHEHPVNNTSEQLLEQMQQSASWNPLMMSNFVSSLSAAEMLEKLISDQEKSQNLLASINSSIMDLRSGRSGSIANDSNADLSEVETLKSQLEAANARIAELENEKSQIKQSSETTIKHLESHLSDQCQQNKKLREDLDEKMDELRLSQDELKTQRLELGTQRTIVSDLQGKNEYITQLCHMYEDRMKPLEQIAASYHERSERQNSSGTQTVAQSTQSVTSTAPFEKVQINYPLACNSFSSKSIICNLCQTDCPTSDYYNYHLETTHSSSSKNNKYQPVSEQLLTNQENKVEEEQNSITKVDERPSFKAEEDLISFSTRSNGTYTPVSEFSASFVIDSAASTHSASTAEEALTDTSISDEESDDHISTTSDDDDDEEEEEESSLVDESSLRSYMTPDEENSTQADDMSIISSRVVNEEYEDGVEMDSVAPSEFPDVESLISEAPIVEDQVPVQQQKPVMARPLPISENVVKHQFFLCDCLSAFPSRGSLITHRAYCTTANS